MTAFLKTAQRPVGSWFGGKWVVRSCLIRLLLRKMPARNLQQ